MDYLWKSFSLLPLDVHSGDIESSSLKIVVAFFLSDKKRMMAYVIKGNHSPNKNEENDFSSIKNVSLCISLQNGEKEFSHESKGLSLVNGHDI